MKLKLHFIYDVVLFGLILYAFVFGGFLQFVIGFSPTIFSFFITFSVLFLLLIYGKIRVDKRGFYFILITSTLVFYTFYISFFHNNDLIRPTIYSLFFLTPFMVYVLIENTNDPKRYGIQRIKKLLLILAICQFPILVVQKYFYHTIMSFNHSGQLIRDVDFMFGTFLVKNDHALGFFIIANILFVWTNSIMKNLLQQLFVTFILVLNVLFTNSKISILVAGLALCYVLILNRKTLIYLIFKFRYVLYFCLFSFLFMIWYFEPSFYFSFKEFLAKKINYETSLKYFKLGLAPREQILVVMFRDGISIFGEGAYTYFDIINGKFEKTYRHFSQLIWFYHDLGIVGLGLLGIYIYRISKLFKHNKSRVSNFLLIGLILYSYFTIVTFDISFVLIYFLYTYTDDKSVSIHPIS